MKQFPSIDMRPLLAELNDEQRSAVMHTSGPLLVLAGAGTGKTRVITTRIANLLSLGTSPESIVAVSFTRKAGLEMQERLCDLVGDTAEDMQVSTFHSLGLSILREQHDELGFVPGFQVCNKRQRLRIAEDVIDDISPGFFEGPTVEGIDAAGLLDGISYAKTCGTEARTLQASEDPYERLIGEALVAYNYALHGNGTLIDLDDMIGLPVRILESTESVRLYYQQRYSHLMIDEYQDSNLLQNRLMRCLLGPEQNICVVGDPEQSIYAFRGARRELILGFEREFPGAKVVLLVRNYRCSRQILDVANEVIQNSPGRYGKRLIAANGRADSVRFCEARDSIHERRFVSLDVEQSRRRDGRAFGDYAVLARSRGDVRDMKKQLESDGIPCGAKGDGVQLLTLHASKGLEFPVVYLTGIQDESLPSWHAINEGTAAIEEERRLFYVGVTRAKKRLTLSSVQRRGPYACRPSRFTEGLFQKRLIDHELLT